MVGTGDLWDYGIFLQCFTDDSGILSVFYIGAMGAGDVKLLGVCAGYFPVKSSLFSIFRAAIRSSFALCKMYLARNLWDRLCYLGEYVWDVVRCGRWKAYFAEERAHPASGICMAGPVFAVCCYT